MGFDGGNWCAIDGHGGVVSVVGAPGIGKSRLVREVTAMAAARGVASAPLPILRRQLGANGGAGARQDYSQGDQGSFADLELTALVAAQFYRHRGCRKSLRRRVFRCGDGAHMDNNDVAYDYLLASTMVKLTGNFAGDTPAEDALGAVTAAAVELIEGVDHADVMLIKDGGFRSVKPTSPVTIRLDNAQRELQEGPCLAAAVGAAVVRSPHLGKDARWPRFGAVAVDAGVHRMLSFQLYTHRSGAGALNLFGGTTGTFDLEAEAIGAMLATHAAAVLIAANRKHQFESALASQDVIGQAKGIIMQRFHVGAVRAFELLIRMSQDSNTPLRMIAQELVTRTTTNHPPRDEVIRGTRC
jgi:hypothetical protein